MTGDFPVGLAASAMRYRDGAFVSDPAGDAREVGTARSRAFPPLALMTHASPINTRHALTDRSTWGVHITQQTLRSSRFLAGGKTRRTSLREMGVAGRARRARQPAAERDAAG